jgi:hypothetical protein
MCLEVIPKLMNTMVVLLMDKGIAASERALDGYCMLHRLFLGCVTEWPELQREVYNRLKKFITTESARTKVVVPSLGDLIPLLSVCESIRWPEFAWPYLTESFDRNVIWICKEYPGLANDTQPGQGADPVRIQKSFEASIVSQRLAMFHAYFLEEIARPRGMSLSTVAERGDLLYGKASLHQKIKFRQGVQAIMDVRGYQNMLRQCGFRAVPSDEQLTDLLKQSVRNSLFKRYHNNQTDFSAIQASGGSTIFSRLKRESAQSGEVVVSLMWNGLDDLDLHVWCPGGQEIAFYNRVAPCCKGELDVDMNAYSKMSEEPVENVFFKNAPKGTYKVAVENYNNRGGTEVPFEVHVSIHGVRKLYKKTWTGQNDLDFKGRVQVCEFKVDKGTPTCKHA